MDICKYVTIRMSKSSLIVVMFVFSCFQCTTSNWKNSPLKINGAARMSILKYITLVPSVLVISAPNSNAAKGAFELDAEYYFKNLMGTKQSSQDKLVSSSTIKYTLPRTLDFIFAEDITNCILEAIVSSCKVSKEVFVNSVNIDLPYAIKYFNSFASFKKTSLDDQYYFDMILYLHYLKAGNILLKSEDRVNLRQNVGENILKLLQSKYNIMNPTNTNNESLSALSSSTSSYTSSASSPRLTKANQIITFSQTIKDVLNVFKQKKIIADYTFDDENLTDFDYIVKSLNDQLPINFQIIIQSPATILSFIEQYKLDSFYHPEIIATTLCQLSKQFQCKQLEVEDYLLDNEYRTNDFSIQAQDILYEFRLTVV